MLNDLKQRFLKFDTIHGLYKIPLGVLIIYLGLFHIQWVIQGLAVLVGLKNTVEGLHDLFSNPVKAKAALNAAVAKHEEAKNATVTNIPVQ